MELVKLACAKIIFYLNFLILCTTVNVASFNLPFHKRTNTKLLKPVLHFQSDDRIPEYEVVQLRFLSKRSTDNQEVISVHLSAFGKDIHLHLKRDDDFNDKLNTVKVFEANFNENGSVQLGEVIIENDNYGTPYIDQEHLAAVTLRHGPDGKLQMEGVIGDDLFIEPASADINFLSDYFTYDWETTDENNRNHSSGKHAKNTLEYSSSAMTKSGVHIVHKSLTKTKKSLKVALDDALKASNDSAPDGNNSKRPISPLHIWVEILLMVDFDTYTMHVDHGFNETQIRRYYVSFLNGVDLRFKTISSPRISLILTQIVIFKSRDATPFLQKNMYANRIVFNGHRAIKDLSHHLYEAKMQKSVYADFDIAILMTNLDMCTEEIIFCNTATVGLAYFKGACVVMDGDRWMGVAIIEDNGGYDGILTAAHEIGHLLGVDHDGSHQTLLDAGDYPYCLPKDGYIMSNAVTSDRIFRWSVCSLKQFKYFLHSGVVSCLLNEPNYPNKLTESEMPGVVLSLDEQCKRVWGTLACAWDDRVCVSLRCYKPKETVVRICLSGLPPAAEGSSCGEDKHCRHGKCVSKSLIYSPAWYMIDVWKYLNLKGLSSTKEPPPDEACEESSAEFCETYFLNVGNEGCKHTRIIEECCDTQKFYCKI